MACEEGVLLGFDYSTSVAEYRESILKMQQFYKEYEGKATIPSHHQMPAKSDILSVISHCVMIFCQEN